MSDESRSSLFGRIESWAHRAPDKMLYTFLDSRGEVTATYTYSSFTERVDVLARRLAARPDLAAGDRILLVYAPGLEMICALFACARAGFIAVPAAPVTRNGFAAAAHRLERMLLDCSAAAILMDRECEEILQSEIRNDEDSYGSALLRLAWIVTNTADADIPHSGYHPAAPIFFIQYTSGSTSDPKGVMVSFENILHNCDLVVDHETPVTVSWLPQHHDMGLIGYYIYAALTGATTYGFSTATFMQRPSIWLETITRYRATATSAPNFAFEICAREGRTGSGGGIPIRLDSLRFLMAAAEPIRYDVYSKFLRKFAPLGLNPKSFYVSYGLAESTLAVSSYGRKALALNKRYLTRGRIKPVSAASEVGDRVHVMSCGTPLGDTELLIVDPHTLQPVVEDQVGEIWLRGRSKCLGYWGRPDLSADTFEARPVVPGGVREGFLRTGDMGFLSEGELYVCGRHKDIIIVRGQNFYPQDIERAVEDAFPQLRRGCVAAFEVPSDDEAGVALVAETSRRGPRPDPREIVRLVQERLGLRLTRVVLVLPRAVPKTSSGKIRRFKVRELLLSGKLAASTHEYGDEIDVAADAADLGELKRLKRRYNLKGDEEFSLLDAGLDSLDIVVFLHWLKDSIAEKGAALLSDRIDASLLGAFSVREVFAMAERLETAHAAAIVEMQRLVLAHLEDHLAAERMLMKADCEPAFIMPAVSTAPTGPADTILLTGATGFLGPFLLANLLRQTTARIHVLVRAETPERAMERVRESLAATGEAVDPQALDSRVTPLCGALEETRLGLERQQWQRVSEEVDTVYHNGAMVNYLLDYRRSRPANVKGTNEILALAFAGRPKTLNHISTTFIYGWATKDFLYETDRNEGMEHLDFGYSQSKWVSEQLVHRASAAGLPVRIFRPALITPSSAGGGENLDIAIRLLAFMIKYGLGVSARNQVSFVPADVAANNIVGIANQPGSIGRAYHVVRDAVEHMTEITDLITEKTGRTFETFDIKDFVPEVIRRCTRQDILYPLLDFLIGSIDNIASMEFKLYNSDNYRTWRERSPSGRPDPPLSEVVDNILLFLKRKQLLETA